MAEKIITAPIILFTYARPEHTKKTLDYLALNTLANESDLFIFCDGPKNEKAVAGNNAVKEVIKNEAEQNRFRSVTTYISEENKGLARSIISGVTEIIHKFGSCIVLEDDAITSPYFLTYMNECLNKYKDDKRIWSVSGFTYPLKSLENCAHDTYLSYRACSHGWSSWADRWDMVDWEVSDFNELKRSPIKRYKFNRGGNDLYRMLRHQMRGERDSWAIRFCYSQSKNDMYCIYPRVSLVYDIGSDGSGTHCSDKGTGINTVNIETVEHLDVNSPVFDKKILKEFKARYRITFVGAVKWAINKMRKMLRR